MQTTFNSSLAQGITLTSMQAKQFKTSVLSVTMTVPLGKNNGFAAILPHVLLRGTQNHPDMLSLSRKLDTLYGARIVPLIRKAGANLAIGFIADVIDERFANGNLTNEVIDLLCELIHKPALENGFLLSEYVESEKQNLIDRIARLKSDTRSYVVRRMREIMYENEPFGLCEYGNLEEIKTINPQNLTEYLNELISTAPMQIFYCGSVNSNEIENKFKSAFSFKKSNTKPAENIILPAPTEPKYITETMPVSQGKLAIGLRTGVTATSNEYPALMLFSTILGGYTGSRLFKHVREKLSLCYYASCGVDKFTGSMTITSGIENKNAELAQKEILAQIDDMKNGNITEQELFDAKRNILDLLKSMNDSPLTLESYFQSGIMNNISLSLDKLSEQIDKICVQDVIKVGQNIKLDTVYFMKGGESVWHMKPLIK